MWDTGEMNEAPWRGRGATEPQRRGATEEQFERLTKNAKELALGTMFTASQVGELQLAYAKLGFTTEEIEAAGLGLRTDDASMANAPMIRAIIEEIAHHQSLSRGHQEKRMLPAQEEIDKLAPLVQNTLVGGGVFGDDGNR